VLWDGELLQVPLGGNARVTLMILAVSLASGTIGAAGEGKRRLTIRPIMF